MYQTITEAVAANSRYFPDKPAIIYKETILTYRQLIFEALSLAKILHTEYGIDAGSRVMLTGVSREHYVVSFLAVQMLQAVTVPLDRIWTESTILRLYDFIQPDLLLTDISLSRNDVRRASQKELYCKAKEAADKMNESGVEFKTLLFAIAPYLTDGDSIQSKEHTIRNKDSVSEMLFTTGTTGMPKGAMLTYKNVCSIVSNNIQATGFCADDILLNALPLCHSLGLRLLRMALWTGATVVLQNGFSFINELKKNIEKYNCTAFVCVPAIMEQLIRKAEDFSELFGKFRLVEVGAGSLSYDLKKRLPQLLPNTQIYNTWGSSETGGVIFLDVSHRQDKLTALGKPVETASVKVVGASGEEIHAYDIDHAGRLAIRGDMTMAGYYNLPEINKETLVDGWLCTNDLVYTDDEGFVYMLGRADDIINVGGEKVSPIEIENVATECEKVIDAASIGVTDPVMGQVPALFVVVEEPCSEEELNHFLAQHLESFKLPKYIVKTDSIPRNRMKKLDRKAVRKLWEGRECISETDAINDSDLLQLILARKSIRQFTDQTVDKEILKRLVDAGIQAPSGKNLQTWRFTVITNRIKIEQIRQIGSLVAKREKTGFFGFKNPAALILITNDKRNDNGALDSACAAENILLAASAMKLGACWLNGLTRISDQPEVRELLTEINIPERHTVWAMIALGYPAENPRPVPRKNNVTCWIE